MTAKGSWIPLCDLTQLDTDECLDLLAQARANPSSGDHKRKEPVSNPADDVVTLTRIDQHVGDLDPSGEDLQRDWCAKSGPWTKVVRLVVNIEDMSRFGLPWVDAVDAKGRPKKDPRWPAFARKYGLRLDKPVQCEVEAIDPPVLRALASMRSRSTWTGPPTTGCWPLRPLTW
jgi:hypothetical protein